MNKYKVEVIFTDVEGRGYHCAVWHAVGERDLERLISKLKKGIVKSNNSRAGRPLKYRATSDKQVIIREID